MVRTKVARLWPALVAASLIACSNGSANAVSQPSAATPSCTVSGPAKFVDRAGGAAALCQAVEQALGRGDTPGTHRVELSVLSASSMAATVHLADGRTLPELRTGVSDGVINAGVVSRFAQDIANQIASNLKHRP